MPTIQCEVRYVLAERHTGELVRVPYWHLRAASRGPALLVLAAQHGNEVQGCEVLRRFAEICRQELLRGEIYLLPFANLPAVRHRRSHTTLQAEQPYADDRGENMNLTWPGDPQGNDTQRLSYAIYQEIGCRCEVVLDFHSWARFTASCSLPRADYAPSLALAEAAQLRFNQERAAPQRSAAAPRTIAALFNDDGRAGLSVELSHQWLLREKEIQLGLRAACNIARHLGLLPGDIERLEGPQLFFHEAELRQRLQIVRAPQSGLFVENGLETADYVPAGQALGHLLCDEDLQTIEIVAPVSGYLWQYGCHREHADVRLPAMHPYADAGDILAALFPGPPPP